MDMFMAVIFMAFIVWLVYRSLARWIQELSLRIDGLEARLRHMQKQMPAAPAATAPPFPAEPQAPAPPPTPPSPAPPPGEAARPPQPPPAPESPTGPAVPPAPPRAPSPEPATAGAVIDGARTIDWEKFMGVKFFAWLGGFAMFLAAALFIRYSFEHNLISPLMRVTAGYFLGVGVIAGGLLLRNRGYGVTVETLCSAGVAILYADVFACRGLYHFFSTEVAFLFMILVTVTAFLLAVRLDSKYVAILGLIGGFLTPPLLSTGEDRPIALFSYIALLDAGLAAVALRKRWGFLTVLSFIATLWMEYAWTWEFFAVNKAELAVGIYLFFVAFYLAVGQIAERRGERSRTFHHPAAYMALLSMGFVLPMLISNSLGARPGLILTFLLLLNAQLAFLALRHDSLRPVHLVGGIVTFLLLGGWTAIHLTPALLPWGLSYYLAFAVLHTAFPVALQRVRPTARPFLWGYLFPLQMLALITFAMVTLGTLYFLVWPFVLLIGMVAAAAAVVAGLVWVAVITLALTMVPFAAWLALMSDVGGLPGILMVLGFFALIFFAGGLFLSRRAASAGAAITPEQAAQLSALSALMPFVLLGMACLQLPVKNPSEIFGLMMLLDLLLLGLVRYRAEGLVALVALLSTGFVESVWHLGHFQKEANAWVLGWYLAFYGIFMIFPFIFQRRLRGTLVWVTAALSGPLHFFLVYDVVTHAWGKAYIGLLPVPFAALSLLGLYRIARTVAADDRRRMTQLALFGGVTLFFVTLIMPLQFENEWLTLGWALEGLALVWLFRRVPHPGLKGWGLVLLGTAFVRLALNPAVLSYHPRAAGAVLNWYLYVYGATAAALFAAARLLAPPRNTWRDLDVPPVLNTLGAILAFLLLNIEIADYFSTGPTITFQFSGNLAQDMTYSLAWALFAVVLLTVGIRAGSRGARVGSLSLLVVTILKVFLHDLWRLGGLYRVVSIFGLAAILILVSFLYQYYLGKERKES